MVKVNSPINTYSVSFVIFDSVPDSYNNPITSNNGIVTRSCFSNLVNISSNIIKIASSEGSAGSLIGR